MRHARIQCGHAFLAHQHLTNKATRLKAISWSGNSMVLPTFCPSLVLNRKLTSFIHLTKLHLFILEHCLNFIYSHFWEHSVYCTSSFWCRSVYLSSKLMFRFRFTLPQRKVFTIIGHTMFYHIEIFLAAPSPLARNFPRK